MDTPEKSDPMPELTAKIKSCDPEMQNFITALKAENLKLQKKIAKLQAENVTLNNRITVLEEQPRTGELNPELKKLLDDITNKSPK